MVGSGVGRPIGQQYREHIIPLEGGGVGHDDGDGWFWQAQPTCPPHLIYSYSARRRRPRLREMRGQGGHWPKSLLDG